MTDLPHLDLAGDVVDLTAALVDIDSESFDEQLIADAVELALREQTSLTVRRYGHTIIARTDRGLAERVVIAGHLDTVPANDNRGARFDGDLLYGLGSCDMKGGVAVALHLAATVPEPNRDVTFVFYDAEEVAEVHNGLGKLVAAQPEELAADFAILMEPSNASIEAGCQGSLRFEVTTRGARAHSARSWMGANAIHALSPVLNLLADYEPRRPTVDGLVYHEGLNAVGIGGGVAGNVVPDAGVVTINYRFAPDRDLDAAQAYIRDLFAGFEVEFTDLAPSARPGLDHPAAAAFVAAAGGQVGPKFGWTDVGRFSALGVPAVNFGPGDPVLAHHADEHVPVAHVRSSAEVLTRWLTV